MPQPHAVRASERIRRELIEADFEIAFNLIDLAQDQSDNARGTRAVGDAQDVLHDIEHRLELLELVDRLPFDPLLGELKRQLTRALEERH